MRVSPDSRAVTFLLGALAALPALSIDISAPTLVLLERALGTTATIAGLTLSLFMVGFAMGQFAGGYGSDSYGRRPVLLASLAVYIIAGAGCAAATSGPMLAALRGVQGVAAGACSVLAFALVQDLFEGEVARRKRSFVTVVFGFVPILAPALGAWLSALATWRATHGVLAAAGVFLLGAVAWTAIGTAPRAPPEAGQAQAPLPPLTKDAPFVRVAAINALSYGSIFTYIAGAPTVIMGIFGHTPAVYAAVFAGTASALTVGAFANARLVRGSAAANRAVAICLGISGGVSILLVLCWLVQPRAALLPLALIVIILFCRGFLAPNLQHIAIERRRSRAGSASAVVGVSQILCGSLTSAIVAVLLPSAGVFAVAIPTLACTGAAGWLWMQRPASNGLP